MGKVIDRSRRGNDPETEKLTGLFYSHEGDRYADKGDFKHAANDYKRAIAFYDNASHNLEGHPKLRDELDKLKRDAEREFREAEKKYHLEEHSSRYPKWLRGLLKYFKGSHVVGSFIFSILFSDPLITGSLIGNNGVGSYLGLIFFLLGIVGCYALFWKNHLLNRVQDQY